MPDLKRILVTGGGGYVGAVLVPRLLERGYRVRVLDLFLYGQDVLDPVAGHPALEMIRGDIRDPGLLSAVFEGMDAVIHLACISNDPSFELNPALGKSINLDAFGPLVEAARQARVRRFVFASSSSVYGLKSEPDVTEDMPLEPLTDYSRFKAECESRLLELQTSGFEAVVVRPATVCGYSPRQRLDVVVNILTNHAVCTGRIRVFGGQQMRPNLHIQDMVDAYLLMLSAESRLVAGQIFNVGWENRTVLELAEVVRQVVGRERVSLEQQPSDDQRSYHISSEKIRRELGFRPGRTVERAVRDLVRAFEQGLLPDSLSDSRYFNIKRMQEVGLE